MSKRPQTLLEAATEFRDAVDAFCQVVVAQLRLVELCDWLVVQLARWRRWR